MKIIQIFPIIQPSTYMDEDGGVQVNDLGTSIYGLTDEGEVMIYNYEDCEWESVKTSIERDKAQRKFIESVQKKVQ